MPPPRPRRLLLALLVLPVLFLLSLYLSRPTFSDLFTARSSRLPDEIFGFLHFVTSPDEAHRVITAPGDPLRSWEDVDAVGDIDMPVEHGNAIAPHEPIDVTWYALGSITKAASERTRAGSSASDDSGWDDRLSVLHREHPVIVFSKTYCRYSKRVKDLLEMYDLVPAPKVVEVDLRADAPHIKTLLTRLTRHSTFPNVLLHGRSLGGSDDLIRLHEEGRLRQVLETAGVKVRWTGEEARL